MKAVKVFMNSGFLLTLAFLVTFDLIITGLLPSLNPLWYDKYFPECNKKCANVVSYLTSPNNPTVLLLGSSLIKTAAANTDSIDCQTKVISDYNKAVFFQETLKKKLGSGVEVLSLAMQGCMASDYGLILRKSIELGKQPEFVVCCTAPAEFLSNDQPVVKNTYVHQCLLSYQFPQGQPPWTVAYNTLERAYAPHSLEAVERVLTYARRSLCAYLSGTTGHPLDIYSAVQQKAAGLKSSKIEDLPSSPSSNSGQFWDLAHYDMRYNPPNGPLFKEHMQNFEAMLKLCHDRGIPIVIVNMPITDVNKSLIKPWVLKKYYDKMSELTSRYEITYWNMDSPNSYALSDYQDSTHLNGAGGRKFFSALANNLLKQRDFSSIAQSAARPAL